MGKDRREIEADYAYEVWRSGGNPDNVDYDSIPQDWDWVYDHIEHPTPHPTKED